MLQSPEEAVGTRTGLILAGLAALVLALKLPTLSTPGFWDELGYLDQARWLAENSVVRVVPGLRPAAAFWGHPPGLHLTLAVLWKVLGPSLAVAHFVIACFAAVGVCSTFLLARLWYDLRTALVASVLLAITPAFVGPAGLFLADVPVASLGVLSAYLACRNRLVAYLLCATFMVLIKETAIAIVAAIVLHRLIQRDGWRLTNIDLADAARYSLPLVAIGAFAVIQKVTTGHFFFIFDFAFDTLFVRTPAAVLQQTARISRWIFVDQFRWLLTLALLANLAINRRSAARSHLVLPALIAIMSGYAFALLYYMPRYVLPVLPFFYISCSAALMQLAKTSRRQVAAGAVAIALTGWSLIRDPIRGHGEDNMQYLHIVDLHRAMATYVEATFPGARILSSWPVATELGDPLYGYVSKSLRVVWFEQGGGLGDTELAIVSRPSNTRAEELRALAVRSSWRLVRRFEHGPAYVELYAR